MSFISPTAHHKFILQCQSLISNASEESEVDEKTRRFKSDLAELQQLIETYLNAVAQLPVITREYNDLQRRIRINARRMQPTRNAGGVKK